MFFFVSKKCVLDNVNLDKSSVTIITIYFGNFYYGFLYNIFSKVYI
uniref:Uncharacterized protein n=1 Tax=viral metagenome TaxID=1070528 RepID=A0A6C0DCK1_9ZZZZ